MTLSEFIQQHGLTMTASPATSNPNMADEMPGGYHWTCTISNGSRSMVVPFSMGAAHVEKLPLPEAVAATRFKLGGDHMTRRDYDTCPKPGPNVGRVTLHQDTIRKLIFRPKAPELADVLDCLASDASSYENAASFEDWASEYGMDTDSRKAEATYRVTGEQSKQLRQLLGLDAYRVLVEEVERL